MSGDLRSPTGESAAVNLSNCDREQIHIPSSIQPHGVLLVLDAESLSVIQVSENTGRWLGMQGDAVLCRSLSEIVGPRSGRLLCSDIAKTQIRNRPQLLRTVSIDRDGVEQQFHAIIHRTEDYFIMELEAVAVPHSIDDAPTDIHALVDIFTLKAEDAKTIAELSQTTAHSIRQLTGFDRVLVYQFDEDWHGIVVGEDGNGELPSLLHHRFPASDIPLQARELYRINRLRIIPDAAYTPVGLTPLVNPLTGRPLDMTFSTLRSVSPIHLQYMKNMATASSMSVSILQGGNLWGLISCHNHRPLHIPFPTRGTCDLFARAFSLRLSALERTQEFERGVEVKSIFTKLFAVMADSNNFATALSNHGEELLAFVGASGAAVATDRGYLLVGKTPTEREVQEMAEWLFKTNSREVYETDCLSSSYPPAECYTATASGLLAIAVSKIHAGYVMWFRPEVIHTIQWGGHPKKNIEYVEGEFKIHPRQSFETWKETVQGRSLLWTKNEIEGATDLRNAIVGIVLRRAEEIAELNYELTRSNRELEAFSYSVSHDLRAPLRHIVGYAEILRESISDKLSPKDQRFINTIIESSEYAGKLVEKLLEFSRLGRAELQFNTVDLNALVADVQGEIMHETAGRKIVWKIGKLPVVRVDLMMLRMAVRDLIANAVKYSRQRDEAVIEIESYGDDREIVVSIKDNGVGFDMQYADKLFGVFQRLHRWEDFEGTGIGLANVQRVMERHGGRAWADGQEGKGATFSFALPRKYLQD